MENFKFLQDEAIVDASEDILKHQSIAETLRVIINKSPVPFTIGLFGKWGAGKSTISNFLKSKLNTKSNKTPVVLFDVWKYEHDYLRRQFLLELVEQLKLQESLNNNFEVDERVNDAISETFQSRITVDKAKLVQLGIILIASVIAIGLFIYFNHQPLLPAYVASTLSSIITVVGLATLLQYITQVIKTETKTVSSNKFTDPDEFESEFERIITESSAKKIVIIFDNLDRVTHDKAVELLSTIKTFLEPKSKKCVFLVPCDEDAIKSYLESVYTDSRKNPNFSAEEFLRKYFNTFIRIPDFIGVDLEDYTKKQLAITEVSKFQNNTDLVTVITQAFRDNPRQIKQFINTLLSHYLLAIEREKGKDALIKPAGTVTDNPAFLAKILIIKQKWSTFYKEVILDPNKFESPDDNDLKIYMSGTSITTTTNLRAFIFLKQPSSKLAIVGIESESLEIAFKDNKADEAIKIINSIKNEEELENKLFDFIKTILNENKEVKQTLVNIINVTDKTIKHLGVSLVGNTDFSEAIIAAVTYNLREVLHTISQEFIFTCLTQSRKAKNKEVIAQYITLVANAKEPSSPINNTELTELSKNISQNLSLFQSHAGDVANALKTGAFDNVSVLSVFFQSKQIMDAFINKEIIQKMLESITLNDFATLEDKSNVFDKKMALTLSDHIELDSGVVKELMKKLTNLINELNQTTQSPENTNIIIEILKQLEKTFSRESEEVDVAEADNLLRILNESIARISGQLERAPFIPVILQLKPLVSESNKGLIDTLVSQYGGHGNLEHYKKLIESRNKEMALFLLSPIKNQIENLGYSDVNFLDFLWPYESEDDKNRIILELINKGSIEFATHLISVEENKLRDEKLIVQNLLNYITTTVPIQLREKIYSTITQMNFAGDEDLKNQYTNQIEQLFLSVDSTQLSLANQQYDLTIKQFLKETRVHVLENVIAWLIKQVAVTISHRVQLELIISNWKEVSDKSQEELLTYIFEKLTKEMQMPDEVDMVYELLRNSKIPKTKIKKFMPNVEERIVTEQNPDIKKTLEELVPFYK